MEHPVRLIIVDDSPRSRDGLQALLDTWPGVQVVGQAVNGREAVQLVEECSPDVVLMDASMPVMDGLDATRLITQRCPTVRVIVLSMYPAFHHSAMTAGAQAFLVKGCPPEELLEAIRNPNAS
jgi:YesN/AraC family two-component response regulator